MISMILGIQHVSQQRRSGDMVEVMILQDSETHFGSA